MTTAAPEARSVHADVRGVALVASTADAVAALDAAVDAFAAHRADLLGRIDAALDLDPGLLRAHLLRGTAIRLSGRTSDLPLARAAVAAARASAAERGATPGEAALVRALDAWCARDADRAASELETALDLEPRDLFALKASHALHFMLGRTRAMRRSVERALPAWRDRGLRGVGAVLGCHAFTLLETGAIAEGERTGRIACELEDNTWSLHAVGHALYARGLHEAGATWLSDREHVLRGVGSLALHVRWHAAVFALACGRRDEALAVYDRWLAPRLMPDYRDFVNASSLLLRLELAGLDVGARWAPLCAVAETHGRDHGLGFADVHYALALSAGGRGSTLAAHLGSLERAATEAPGVDGRTLREVAVPLVRAMSVARVSTAEALAQLRRVEPLLPRLGGSVPQREVFAVLAERWGGAGPAEVMREAPSAHHGRSAGLS